MHIIHKLFTSSYIPTLSLKICIVDAFLFNPACANVPVRTTNSHAQSISPGLAGPSVSTTTAVSTQTAETFAAHGCQCSLHTSSSQMQILLSSRSWAMLPTSSKYFSAPVVANRGAQLRHTGSSRRRQYSGAKTS